MPFGELEDLRASKVNQSINNSTVYVHKNEAIVWILIVVGKAYYSRCSWGLNSVVLPDQQRF